MVDPVNKKLLIIVGAVVLLGGGGGGAAFMMMGGDPPPAEETAEAEAVVEDAQKAADLDDDPIYLRMDGMTVPVLKGNRIRHYLFLNMMLEMNSEDDREKAARLKPRLHDAFLREFYSRSVIDSHVSGAIDFPKMKRRLIKQANKVLGNDGVRNILITRAMRGAG